MTSALQNRLVGTIIIVAIAVIFLPDLLDGKKESKRNLFVELPQKPEMKAVKSPAEFDIDKVQQASTRKVEIVSEQATDDEPGFNESSASEQSNTPEVNDRKIADVTVNDGQIVDAVSSTISEAANQDTANTTNTLEQQTVVEQDRKGLLASAGWVVQLGSFRHQKNVRELLSKLEKSGYRAFSRPVETSSGTLTKVFVGPDLQKDKLTNALSHLKEVTGLQGRITPFTVQ